MPLQYQQKVLPFDIVYTNLADRQS